jgi:hypothetical protein
MVRKSHLTHAPVRPDVIPHLDPAPVQTNIQPIMDQRPSRLRMAAGAVQEAFMDFLTLLLFPSCFNGIIRQPTLAI